MEEHAFIGVVVVGLGYLPATVDIPLPHLGVHNPLNLNSVMVENQ